MGTKGSGPYFQRVTATLVLDRFIYLICKSYIDDILIDSADMVVVKSLTDCLLSTTKLKKYLTKTGRLTEERSSLIKRIQLMIVHRIHHQLRVDRAIPLQGDRVRLMDGLPLVIMRPIRRFITLVAKSQLGEGVLLVLSPAKVELLIHLVISVERFKNFEMNFPTQSCGFSSF